MTTARSKGGSTLVACTCIAFGITLIYAIVGGIIRPAMFSDSAWGFLGWHSGTGLPLNFSAGVDSGNIARNTMGFMGWWTPGQHVLPGLLEAMGLDLGLAIIVVVTVFSGLGLLGWSTLYRAFGFPVETSAAATAIIACTHHFALPFTNYNGGEVLMFGTAPWFLVLVWRLRELRWTAVLPLLAGAVVMVFAKLSGFLLSVIAVGAAAGSSGRWFGNETMRRALVAGSTILLMGALFYFLWLSRSRTPVSAVSLQSGVDLPELLRFAAFAIGAVWSAALSLGQIADFLVRHPGRPLLDSLLTVHCGFLPLTVATFTFVWWQLRREHADYLRFVALLAVVMAGMLALTVATGAKVSTDERHLRVVSLVLLGGIVHSFLGWPGLWLRSAFAAVLVVAGIFGVSSFAWHSATSLKRPLSDHGFRHWIADAPLLDFIHKIDVAGPDAASTLIMFTAPEIAVEARNVRVMSDVADFQTIEELDRDSKRGKVPRLYVVVQKKLVDNGKGAAVLRSFVDYPAASWQEMPVGEFVVYFSEVGAH